VNASVVGIIVFACAFGGALLGMWLRKALPEHHFDAESRDTVKVGIGLIATMTALVLGLVTASAKGSFDEMNTAVKQFAIQVLALDRALARYGPETGVIRQGLQQAIEARIDSIWPSESSTPVSLDPLGGQKAEGLSDAIMRLQPQDESQQVFQSQALDLGEAILQERWLVIADAGTSIPLPFLTILIFWLTITFISFGLFAPWNGVVLTVLFVCALSVGSSVFLVLEMDGPFEGLLKASADPLRAAVAHMKQ
jgi:hypothetical protein